MRRTPSPALRMIGLALFALTCFSACGGSGHAPTYPIELIIVPPSGVSLAGGIVTLTSQTHGVSAAGTIDASGKCSVGTYAPHDGAVEGVHQVSIVAPRPAGDPDEVAARELIAANYANPATSGLTIDVLPDGPNKFTLQVNAPQP